MLPAPTALPAPAPAAEPVHAPANVLPIDLDTVLRLAQDQNVKVNLAREQLQEAFAARDVAEKGWLPEVDVGPSYYRHEGGIQNEDGTLTHSSFGALFAGVEIHSRVDLHEYVYRKVDAQRKVWQQKGELSRMTSETLLDATSTYVDLLAARAGEAIAREVQANLDRLLEQARKRAATDPGAQVEVDRVATEIAAQKQITRKVREGGTSSAARLSYLLGVDPSLELVLTDRRMVPFHLVDPNRPVGDLVTQALTNGPGVREMEGLLALIHSTIEKAKGPGRLLPVFELRVAEGAFGAGPGDDMRWDNRMDLALQARWNLTGLFTAQERQRLAQSKLAQAHLGYDDLRGRLTLGVREARESTLSNLDQLRLAEEQIERAREAYKRSQFRLTQNIKGNSPSEVLLSIRSLGVAQLNYLSAVRDFDKAQLRLMVLLGGADASCHK
jgi:outer membrane protein TolC